MEKMPVLASDPPGPVPDEVREADRAVEAHRVDDEQRRQQRPHVEVWDLPVGHFQVIAEILHFVAQISPKSLIWTPMFCYF